MGELTAGLVLNLARLEALLDSLAKADLEVRRFMDAAAVNVGFADYAALKAHVGEVATLRLQ